MVADLKHWLSDDKYSPLDVACLLAGIDPLFLQRVELDEQGQPTNKGLEFLQKQTTVEQVNQFSFYRKKINLDRLEGTLSTEIYPSFDGDTNTYITKENLLIWAYSYGFDFPKGYTVPPPESLAIKPVDPIETLLTQGHPRYSEDLDIAITVWKELEDAEIPIGSTFKAEAEKLIRKLRPKWTQTRIDRISRIVNYKPGTTSEKAWN